MKTRLTHAGGGAGRNTSIPSRRPRRRWARTRWLLVAVLTPLLALTTTPANAQGHWFTVPDLPTARYGLAGTSAPCPNDVKGLKGTCVYAIGGHTGSPTSDKVEAYSPDTNTWRTLPSLPTARYALTAATAACPKDVEGLKGTCVYAIGGFTGAEWPDPVHDVGTVEAYSPATNTWRTLPSLPTARSFPAATTGPCPKYVEGLRGSCVYAVGGAFGNTVEAYSPATNAWRTLPSLGTSRDAPGAATAPCPKDIKGLRGDCVYAIGGFNPAEGILDTVEAYSAATNSWQPVASLGAARVALAGASAPCPKADRNLKSKSTCAYAIAGFTSFTDFATNTAEVFSPRTNIWSSLPDLATARFELAAATAPCPKNVRGRQQQTCLYAIGGIGDSPSFPTLRSVEALPVGG